MRNIRCGTEARSSRDVYLRRARRVMLFTTACTQALACEIIVTEDQPLELAQARQMRRDRTWGEITAEVVADVSSHQNDGELRHKNHRRWSPSARVMST